MRQLLSCRAARAAVVLALAAGLAAPLAATTLNVDTRPGFRAGLRVVAVAPIDCKAGLDCEEIERRVEEALREGPGLEVVGAGEMRDEMDGWGMRELTPGNLMALGEDLEADAVLTIDLFPSGSGEGFRPRWSPLSPRGVTFSKSLKGKKDAVQVHLLSAETGETLVEGTAVGKSLTGTSTARATKQILELLARAFAQ